MATIISEPTPEQKAEQQRQLKRWDDERKARLRYEDDKAAWEKQQGIGDVGDWYKGTKLDSLQCGKYMRRLDYLVSPNGQRQLRFQNDSNLVLYPEPVVNDWQKPKAVWASDTWEQPYNQQPKVEYATLREDGNFVVLGYPGTVAWESKTAGKGNKSSVLTVEDSGKAVIKSDGKVIWESPIEMTGWKPKN